jgi:hypothetical protein
MRATSSDQGHSFRRWISVSSDLNTLRPAWTDSSATIGVITVISPTWVTQTSTCSGGFSQSPRYCWKALRRKSSSPAEGTALIAAVNSSVAPLFWPRTPVSSHHRCYLAPTLRPCYSASSYAFYQPPTIRFTFRVSADQRQACCLHSVVSQLERPEQMSQSSSARAVRFHFRPLGPQSRSRSPKTP